MLNLILLQILVSAALFGGVFLTVYAVFRYPVPAEPPIHRRIASAVGEDRRTLFESPVMAPIMNLGLQASSRCNIPFLRKRIRQDLDASGNPSGYSVHEYLALCLVTAGLIGLAAAFVELLMGSGLLLLTVPLTAFLGFAAPLYALHDSANRRVMRVSKQLPYTLDLVSLVMAAGSSFNEACETLIRDNPDDDLNQELQLALSEIEFGATRAAALKNLADRIPLESLRSVVGAVNQAERLGTPLSSILKMQAEMLRMHRSVRAEKLSASASLRILLPGVLILFAVVIIVFAPMVIRFYENGSMF